jgi:hypothetical protein
VPVLASRLVSHEGLLIRRKRGVAAVHPIYWRSPTSGAGCRLALRTPAGKSMVERWLLWLWSRRGFLNKAGIPPIKTRDENSSKPRPRAWRPRRPAALRESHFESPHCRKAATHSGLSTIRHLKVGDAGLACGLRRQKIERLPIETRITLFAKLLAAHRIERRMTKGMRRCS